jgi:DNA-binding MarR family transcriptional regulator
MEPKRASVDAAVEGYRELVQLLAGARSPELPDSSVTMAQMRVLMLLNALGEVRMSEAATALGVSQSTASGLVDRLVESGLVGRNSDAHDRRQVLVSLTADGVAFLDHFQELGISHLRQLMADFSAEEIAAVQRAIDLLIGAAQQLRREGTP